MPQIVYRSLVVHLERQLTRVIKLNPPVQDTLALNEPAPDNGDPTDMQNQIAALLQNSTLLRSYENMMQQYEDSLT